MKSRVLVQASEQSAHSRSADVTANLRESGTAPIAGGIPGALAQRRLQSMINNSPQAMQLKALAFEINSSQLMVAQRAKLTDCVEPVRQRAPTGGTESALHGNNRTGLPDDLKAGVESLSGMSMDHVRVHFNSPQPAQLNAHAYAQGGEIYVAPGQERHLPHEAWHVAQQAQGRVKPTTQMAGAAVNDNISLEGEADVMGAKALARGALQLAKNRDVANLKAPTFLRPAQMIQCKKTLGSPPPQPEKPEWESAPYAAQYADLDEQSEEQKEPEADEQQASSVSSSAPKLRTAPDTFSLMAMKGTQAGSTATLWLMPYNIPKHHLSFECKWLENGRLSITGGHLTDESFPEGHAKRRVRDVDAGELKSYKDAVAKRQMKLDEDAEKSRIQKKVTRKAVAKTAEESSRRGELKDAVFKIVKDPKRQQAIPDDLFNTAMKKGWGPADITKLDASVLQDPVQLARIES